MKPSAGAGQTGVAHSLFCQVARGLQSGQRRLGGSDILPARALDGQRLLFLGGFQGGLPGLHPSPGAVHLLLGDAVGEPQRLFAGQSEFGLLEVGPGRDDRRSGPFDFLRPAALLEPLHEPSLRRHLPGQATGLQPEPGRIEFGNHLPLADPSPLVHGQGKNPAPILKG